MTRMLSSKVVLESLIIFFANPFSWMPSNLICGMILSYSHSDECYYNSNTQELAAQLFALANLAVIYLSHNSKMHSIVSCQQNSLFTKQSLSHVTNKITSKVNKEFIDSCLIVHEDLLCVKSRITESSSFDPQSFITEHELITNTLQAMNATLHFHNSNHYISRKRTPTIVLKDEGDTFETFPVFVNFI